MQDQRLPGAPITATNLKETFGTRTLWHDLSFTIEPGHMIALTGPSGSGKSTLLNCIGLIEQPDEGTLTCGTSELTGMNRHQARCFRKHQLGYLFQDYALIDNATIGQNLDIAFTTRTSRNDRRKAINQTLEQVGLAGRSSDPVYQLSGGEQQRVALARLIIKQPGIILADEPTGALDHTNADMVITTLRTMATNGGVVIIATHSQRITQACDTTIDLE